MLFLNGLRATYLWLAGLNATAIIPSMLRGKGTNKTQNQILDKEVVVDL
jgi:hypothetical protein